MKKLIFLQKSWWKSFRSGQRPFLVLLSLGLFVPAAHGQFPYHPYYNPYYGNMRALGPGFYLQGAASVISSVGNLYVQQENAGILREKANQARIETKKRAFDELMYEKANTPTFTEETEYKTGLLTRRMMTNPTKGEITRGDTLNAMMPLIKDLEAQGVMGPPIAVDPDQLKNVNISVGKGGNSLGVLKGDGNLDWPISVQGPRQEKLASLVPMAISQTAMGKLKPKLYREITSELEDLQEELRKKFLKEEVDTSSYLVGKHFLQSLDQSVRGLVQPEARQVLNGGYVPQGGNVPEVVHNMASKGMTFAPANPGQEAVYFALHNAFVSYISAAQASSGFQMRFNPPRTDPFIIK